MSNKDFANDTRIALLEQSIGHINETMLRMEKRFDIIDKRFDNIDKKFNDVDRKFNDVDQKIERLNEKMSGRFDKLESRIWTLYFWMIGGFASLAGIIARAHHWI